MTKFESNNTAVNKGFPERMTYQDLVPLTVLEIRWNDAPNSQVLVTSVATYAHNYKGERSFQALDAEGVSHRIVHTQIARIVQRAKDVADDLFDAALPMEPKRDHAPKPIRISRPKKLSDMDPDLLTKINKVVADVFPSFSYTKRYASLSASDVLRIKLYGIEFTHRTVDNKMRELRRGLSDLQLPSHTELVRSAIGGVQSVVVLVYLPKTSS
jgi:hypothetical protein